MWWPQSRCPGRAVGRWARVQSGQGWRHPTPHSPRDSPSPSAGPPSSRTQPSAEDRQEETWLTNKQTRHTAENIYTNNTFYKGINRDTQCWKQRGSTILCVHRSNSFPCLFCTKSIPLIMHNWNYSIWLLILNFSSFFKLIKFKYAKGVLWKVERMICVWYCVMMQYWYFILTQSKALNGKTS